MSIMAQLMEGLFSAYWYLLIIVVFVRLIPDFAQTGVGRVLTRLTDPYLYVFRRYIPPLPIGQISLDLSWMVGVGVFFVIQTAVSETISHLLLTM